MPVATATTRPGSYGVCDYYDAESLLTADERRVLGRLRELPGREGEAAAGRVLGTRRVPGPAGPAADRPGPDGAGGTDRRPGCSSDPARGIYQGFRIFELARTDASLATWYTAQAGLFRTAIRVGASAEQQAEWMPQGHRLLAQGRLLADRTGVRLGHRRRTVHHRPPRSGDGDTWVLDGAKRWIGGAATADVLAVFARDVADGQVKAFLVDREAAGVTLEKIHGKTSLRMMQNAAHHPRRASASRSPCGCTT